jgi:hypothetical protein
VTPSSGHILYVSLLKLFKSKVRFSHSSHEKSSQLGFKRVLTRLERAVVMIIATLNPVLLLAVVDYVTD